MTPSRPPRTLRRKVRRTLTAAAAAVAVVLAWAGVALIQTRAHQTEVVDVYFPAVVHAEATATVLVDAEIAVQQYLLTGHAGVLEPFDRVRGASAADHIGPVLEIRPDLRPDYDRAVDSTSAWFTDFALPAIEQVDADGPGTVETADVARGADLFAQARADIEAFTEALAASRLQAAAQLEWWSRMLFVAVVVLVAVTVATAVVLRARLQRWVTDPLSDLARQSRAVVEEERAAPVTGRGAAEIVSLAGDIEYMRQRLLARTAEVERSRAELERAHRTVSEQAAELRRSNRDLEQFAYVASHDLQEPLRKVASFTQLLQRRYGNQLDERADQYIDFAVDGAKRMQRLISDLLGFSRVGRVGGEVTAVPLVECAQEAVANLERAIAEAGARVTWGELPVVRGERALLVQLLQNLIGNAVKFRHPDRPAEVHLSARRRPGAWELSCRDNGIGIDEKYAERVFVIFQRLHPKDVYTGTGIGLALCKRIVEYHGGEIRVEPAEVGTVITWTLPDGTDRAGHDDRATRDAPGRAGDGKDAP